MANWKAKVNVAAEFRAFEDGSMPFEEVRDGIVAKLDKLSSPTRPRKLRIFEDEQDQLRFEEAVDALRYAEDVEEFDGYWSDLYDLADDNLLWIEVMFLPGE